MVDRVLNQSRNRSKKSMNDFLDNLANHQYRKIPDKVEVEECKNTKLKDMDSAFEIDIDYIIDLTCEEDK